MAFEDPANFPRLKVCVEDDVRLENISASSDMLQATRKDLEAQLPEIPEDVVRIFRPVDCWEYGMLPVTRSFRLVSDDLPVNLTVMNCNPRVTVVLGGEYSYERAMEIQWLPEGEIDLPAIAVALSSDYPDVVENFDNMLRRYYPLPPVIVDFELISELPCNVALQFGVIPVASKADGKLLVVCEEKLSKNSLQKIENLCERSVRQTNAKKYDEFRQNIPSLLEFYYRDREISPPLPLLNLDT